MENRNDKYTFDELCGIMEEHGWELDEEAKKLYEEKRKKSDWEKLEELKKAMMKGAKDDDDDDDDNPDSEVDEQEDEEKSTLEDIPEETFEESLKFLDDMVGMENVKESLLRLGRYVQWKKKLLFVGIDTSEFPEPNLTFMFLGDSGTGKTTVAYRMGRILHSLGLLPSRKVVEFHRSDLMGENYGSEEVNTKEALKKSMGSVMFLDETYQCFKQATDHRDPGYHILEVMMQEFGKPGRCIIMAGYKKEMMEIFNVNPGFRSRIPDENIIELKGMSEETLMHVATRNFDKMEFSLTSGARKLIRDTIRTMCLTKDKDFGNARNVKQLTESIVISHANRIMTTTQCDDFTISKDDVRRSIDRQIQKSPTRNRIGYV